MGIRGELYTNQVLLNNRSYFFNVKENRNGDIFLQIVESKIKDGVDDRRAIVVFADDMQRFLTGMDDSLNFIEKERKARAKLRAERRAERDAKYGAQGDGAFFEGAKKIYRRKGESRFGEARDDVKEDTGIKRTGRVMRVVSKRPAEENPEQ
ncbi:MAG: DUF3276 family protein [Treponema sp.]|nr:DUF3276 family protein [Treponema sp.]